MNLTVKRVTPREANTDGSPSTNGVQVNAHNVDLTVVGFEIDNWWLSLTLVFVTLLHYALRRCGHDY